MHRLPIVLGFVGLSVRAFTAPVVAMGAGRVEVTPASTSPVLAVFVLGAGFLAYGLVSASRRRIRVRA